MEPEPTNTTASVVSNAVTSSGLSVTLHPLVILNISDHFTRTKMQQQNPRPRVIGALLGIQRGRDVEICNSYELKWAEADGSITIDRDFLLAKQDQMKQVFKEFDFLGWYTTGSELTPTEIHIHQQILQFNESPIFVNLNPFIDPVSKELPIHIYESIIEVLEGAPKTMFVKMPYKIETVESERVAVDGVAKASTTDSVSSLLPPLVTQRNAIQMLHQRLNVLKSYLESVQSNPTEYFDHHLLREISSLCRRAIPYRQSFDPSSSRMEMSNDEEMDVNANVKNANMLEGLDEELLSALVRDYEDFEMLGFLGALTKSTDTLCDIIDKFNYMQPERRKGTMSTMFM